MSQSWMDRRLGIQPPRGTAPALTPHQMHARLIRFYAPIVDACTGHMLDQLRAGDLTPVALAEGDYPRFPSWDAGVDWRTSFDQPRIDRYVEPIPAGFTRSLTRLDRVPIGKDPELSRRLAEAMGLLHRLADDYLDSSPAQQLLIEHLRANPKEQDVLRDGTILGHAYNADRGISGLARSVSRTMHVSITSLAQSIAQLAIDVAPGTAGDPLALAAALIRGGAVDDLALLLPPNVLGPSSREGLRFPGPLLAGSPGATILHPRFQALLEAEKELYLASLAGKGEQAHAEGRGQVGRGCPMARHSRSDSSGISRLGELLLETMELQHPAVTPSRAAVTPPRPQIEGL